MQLTPLQEVIPQSQILVFAPHFDDLLFGLGGYIEELKANDLLRSKQFHVRVIFSRSNYQANTGQANYDTSLARVKLATGNRLIEDYECIDELLGEHKYRYELLREKECLLRAKNLARDAMEFPQGNYATFDAADAQILERLKAVVKTCALQEDTALVFPLAIKEHIDHFITREAGILTARELGAAARASFYFQEDKPYAGLQSPAEESKVDEFLQAHPLRPILYRGRSTRVIELAYRHYLSQVTDAYRHGITRRVEQLQKRYALDEDCDLIYAFSPQTPTSF